MDTIPPAMTVSDKKERRLVYPVDQAVTRDVLVAAGDAGERGVKICHMNDVLNPRAALDRRGPSQERVDADGRYVPPC